MKLNRKVTRLAASVLATAMFACATALPAMAADGDQVQVPAEGADTLDNITIQKELQKPANVYAPAVTFDFSVAPVEGTEEGALISGEYASGEYSNKTQVNNLEVYNGYTNGVKKVDGSNDGKAKFEPDANDIGTELVTENFTFTIDPNVFPHAGVYKYVVTENSTTDPADYEGIKNDTNDTRYLYVYVENPDVGENGLQVVGAVVRATAGVSGDKTDRFTNTYFDGTTPDPDESANELYITKEVAGALGSLTEEFAFTVAIDGADGEEYYAVNETYDDDSTWKESTQEADKITVVSDAQTATQFKLKNNQRLHIYGLSDTDKYTIIETVANQNGYATKAESSALNEDTISNNEGSGNTTVVGTVNPEATTTKNITYTNTRSSVTPTGVIMNVAPYVLMVVIAAAGCFVFLRKRRDD